MIVLQHVAALEHLGGSFSTMELHLQDVSPRGSMNEACHRRVAEILRRKDAAQDDNSITVLNQSG